MFFIDLLTLGDAAWENTRYLIGLPLGVTLIPSVSLWNLDDESEFFFDNYLVGVIKLFLLVEGFIKC